MKTYSIQDIDKAEHNLEPLKCIFCKSLEVVFIQGVNDAKCQECGKWQRERPKNLRHDVVTPGYGGKRWI